jgi:hypothetical protein
MAPDGSALPERPAGYVGAYVVEAPRARPEGDVPVLSLAAPGYTKAEGVLAVLRAAPEVAAHAAASAAAAAAASTDAAMASSSSSSSSSSARPRRGAFPVLDDKSLTISNLIVGIIAAPATGFGPFLALTHAPEVARLAALNDVKTGKRTRPSPSGECGGTGRSGKDDTNAGAAYSREGRE